MAKLPFSRVVNVTLSREDNFVARRGFGIPLFITSTSVTDVLTSTLRTAVFGSMDEVVAKFASSAEFYKAAEAAFSQNPRPLQIKAGFVTIDGTPTKEELKAELDLLYAYDSDWYWVDVESTLRDTAQVQGLVEWIEAKSRFALLTSNAAGTESTANTTVIAAVNKGTVERTAVFYHTDPAEYPGFALAAKLGTFTFDEPNSAYTAKFKQLNGIAPIDKGSAIVQAITGFTPNLGQATATGHCANTYVDIGGQNFVVEGSTLTPNVFIDEIHATDWIIARTEEEVLNTLLNNNRIEYTDAGMEQLAAPVRTVMAIANRAGLIANDLNDDGDYAPAVEYFIPSVFSVTASQRKARIAPPIQVRFRYSGAVHYCTINYRMTF